VFAFVCFAWIFFRAASVGDAWLIITRIFTTGWADPLVPMLMLGMTLAVWIYQFFYESRGRWIVEWSPVRVGLAALMVVYIAVFAAASSQPFIYFQF
jgi:hypothetical protein